MAASPVTVLVPATAEHVLELGARMRPADAAEVLASGGYAPVDAVADAVAHSAEAWAGLIGGELAAVFGIVPGSFLSFEAYPWLLTTATVERHPRAFLRTCREVVDDWLERYPVLVQAVDARYDAALRWARWLGFEVEPPAPFGVAGLPFCRITMRRGRDV